MKRYTCFRAAASPVTSPILSVVPELLSYKKALYADGVYALSELYQAGHYRLQYTSLNLFHQTTVNAYTQATAL